MLQFSRAPFQGLNKKGSFFLFAFFVLCPRPLSPSLVPFLFFLFPDPEPLLLLVLVLVVICVEAPAPALLLLLLGHRNEAVCV